jgi:tetratricopeptide (TPR) repeat protein
MRRFANAYLSAALLVLTLAAFLPVWDNGFVDLDDEMYITRNPPVLRGWTWSGFRWAWTTFHGTYWQPLSWLSLQGDAQLFSTRTPGGRWVPSPAAFHGVNLLWHAATVVLLFALWGRLTGSRWQSFLVAALFAVHPMRVESVAWATERKDVLSCFFGVLTLWAYARYADRPGWLRYLGVILAFALSLLSKPMLMTLPFVLLLLDYWPLRRTSFLPPTETADGPARASVALGRLVLEKVPLFVLSAGIMTVTLVARDQTWRGVSYEEFPLAERLAHVSVAYGWYLVHSFCPVGLTALYPHPHHDRSVLAMLAGAGAVLAITLLCAWQARRRPWLLVGWLWFVGTIVPVLGLAQAGEQAWADRFTYWPHIGLLVAVVWGLGEIAVRWRVHAAVSGTAAALVLGCLAALTWVQVGTWHDTVTLWEHALAVTQNNYRAHLALGNYYEEQRQLDRAVAHFAECVRIHPNSAPYRFALGSALHQLDREDEAAVQLQEAVRREPDFPQAWHNLGFVRLHQDDPGEAVRCFRRALEGQPETPATLAGLGEALWRDGKRAEAVEAFETALRHNPRQAQAWHGLGVAYLAKGSPDKAADALSQALRFNPNLIAAHSDLGVALGRLGRWADAARCQLTAMQGQSQFDQWRQEMNGRPAVRDSVPQLVVFQCRFGFALRQLGQQEAAARAYRAALQGDPEWPRKFTARARALATDPDVNVRDPRLAYELASQAVQAVSDPPAALLDTLAAAEAALGGARPAH